VAVLLVTGQGDHRGRKHGRGWRLHLPALTEQILCWEMRQISLVPAECGSVVQLLAKPLREDAAFGLTICRV